MFFSARVKQELAKQISPARHCQIAELAAMISMAARPVREESGIGFRIDTENVLLVRKCETLLLRTFSTVPEVMVRRETRSGKDPWYELFLPSMLAEPILQATKQADREGSVQEDLSLSSTLPLQKECCRRAFLRGAFLASGSISNPENSYHFEIVCANRRKAEVLRDVLASFSISARMIERKGHQVVYIKEGSGIVEALGMMEAGVSLMELENIRILKEMRNSVNRKVNCETANIRKTVSAAIRQAEDIELLREKGVLSQLPEHLIEIAEARLADPEATLEELGKMLDPPVGKSGVNHRLRKISEIAEEYRD